MDKKEIEKRGDHILIYVPAELKQKIKDFANEKKITISSLMLFATLKLMKEMENNEVGIFDVIMGVEKELSPYYGPMKLVHSAPAPKKR